MSKKYSDLPNNLISPETAYALVKVLRPTCIGIRWKVDIVPTKLNGLQIERSLELLFPSGKWISSKRYADAEYDKLLCGVLSHIEDALYDCPGFVYKTGKTEEEIEIDKEVWERLKKAGLVWELIR